MFENCVPEKKSVSENCVPEKKSVSEKCVPDKKFTLKYCTGKEFGSQILYPQNILIKSHEISWGTFGSIALVTLITLVTPFHNRREEKTQFFWVPIFESHFLFRYNI